MPNMQTQKRRISINYDSMDVYNECHKKAQEIIQHDTGKKNWQCSKGTKSQPPSENPPPLSPGAIDQLRSLQGVMVKDSMKAPGDD